LILQPRQPATFKSHLAKDITTNRHKHDLILSNTTVFATGI
jgi:hypothetical protein